MFIAAAAGKVIPRQFYECDNTPTQAVDLVYSLAHFDLPLDKIYRKQRPPEEIESKQSLDAVSRLQRVTHDGKSQPMLPECRKAIEMQARHDAYAVNRGHRDPLCGEIGIISDRNQNVGLDYGRGRSGIENQPRPRRGDRAGKLDFDNDWALAGRKHIHQNTQMASSAILPV